MSSRRPWHDEAGAARTIGVRLLLVLIPPAVLAITVVHGMRARPAQTPDPATAGRTGAEPGADAADAPIDLVPLGMLAPLGMPAPWRAVGPVETFPAPRMYEKINGGADAFIDRGARKLVYKGFETEAGDTVDVYAYDMGSDEAALTMFREDSGLEPARREGFRGQVAIVESTAYLACDAWYVQIFAAADGGTEIATRVARDVDHLLSSLLSRTVPASDLYSCPAGSLRGSRGKPLHTTATGGGSVS